jgi:glycosidase
MKIFAAASFGLVCAACSMSVARAQAGEVVAETASHTFTLWAAPDVKSVNVAGTFNNWSTSATPLTRQIDGSWRVDLRLPYGRYEYKFVLDGQNWTPDPSAPKQADASGNVNSILLLAPPDYNIPARSGDGIVALSALSHPRDVPRLNYDQGQLTLTLRARAGDIQAASVRINGRVLPMVLTSSDDLYAFYTARLPWNRKSDLSYRFAVRDGGALKYLGASGVAVSAAVARPFVLSAAKFQPFVVPGWVEKSVIYQIFPDRFANGDKSNDPRDVVAWDTAPTWFNRFGGDAAGVQSHLKYLQDLGVSAVYFNPVFASPSNHRYDASEFKKIDPQFGTNEEFATLTRAMQKRGIRTVMDFVFNHTATNFAPFQDIRDKGETSIYKDWYFIRSFPVRVEDKPNYEAWYGYPSMPKLNVLNPPTRDYLLGLVNFWKQNAALSGLRLDVANEVKPEFWRLLRKRAKGIDSNLWIVGEQWGDAKPWLGGDQWDSVMNYQFRDAALRYFARGETKPSQFVALLMEIYNSYAPQVSRNAMNLLSSHDTPRFLTECKNDAALHRLATTLQFTWPGVPSIYYGEELGMEGGGDPGNRRGMEWSRTNAQNEMLRFYKTLIRVRQSSHALQSGSPQVLVADDAANTLAFARIFGSDAAIVALNRSDEARTMQIPLPPSLRCASWNDAFSGQRIVAGASVRVRLTPKQAAILLAR